MVVASHYARVRPVARTTTHNGDIVLAHTLSLCHSLELAVWREGVDVPYVTDACDSFRNVHIVCIISVRDDMKYLTD